MRDGIYQQCLGFGCQVSAMLLFRFQNLLTPDTINHEQIRSMAKPIISDLAQKTGFSILE